MVKTEQKKVLCPGCNKPIHIEDLAMVDERGFWHSDCIMWEIVSKSGQE